METVVNKASAFPAPPPAGNATSELRRRYRFFKSLLASNNFILEELAALERMTHEGRSFTLDQVTDRVHGLLTRGCSLIEDLNALCSGQHPELFHRLENIGHKALSAFSRHRSFNETVLVRPLSELCLEHLEEVGGKAANLGEIRNKVGLRTPDGFAVTASAAALFLRETGLLEALQRQLATLDITNIAALEQLCAKATERIMAASLPPVLNAALQRQVRELAHAFGPKIRLAVRSSAVCEDSEASFAGQHASVLGTSPETIGRAWSAVVASAFTTRAVFYRRTKGYTEQDVMMSVLVLTMVEPKASGVVYTVDPNSATNDDLLLSSVWGLGLGVVDGSANTDFWRVRRFDRQILKQSIARKESRHAVLAQGGVVKRPVPPELRTKASLTTSQIATLVEQALLLEAHYGTPLDVEWALDAKDDFFILQARPLKRTRGTVPSSCCVYVPGHVPLLTGGQTAATGVAAGVAYIVQPDHLLHDVPQGAILVAKQTSPTYVAAMGRIAGIVTDIGSPTGHMAAVAREFGLPTLVGTEHATKTIPHGTEITLDATNRVLYAGQIQEILSKRKAVNLMQGSPVFKSLQAALKHLTPLNLVDPDIPEFRAKNCRTLHDILRFCHELSMREMFRLGTALSPDTPASRELCADLPFRILILDLGGGLSENSSGQKNIPVDLHELTCAPLQTLLKGMFASSGQTAAPSSPQESQNAVSYAIVSKEYMNFSGRLGNHFATVDCYCGPILNDNYITFSFKGGAAAYVQRVRRATLLAAILRRLGFRITQTGDALKAEIRKYDNTRFLDRLYSLGRLLAAIRALDRRLKDEQEVLLHMEHFFTSTGIFAPS